MSRIGSERGFTLVEVMIAASVMALGAILIYEAFFIALDTFRTSERYLEIAPVANERLWQAQDYLTRLGNLGDLPAEGKFMRGSKLYQWELSSFLRDETVSAKLFQVDVVFSWQEGRRKTNLARSALVLYQE